MNMNGFFPIDLDENLVCLFIHKPYNFKRDAVSLSEQVQALELIQKETEFHFEHFITPQQVHGNTIVCIDETNLNEQFENTDGLITQLKGIALGTRVADCQGILLYDPEHQVIGNIHSGWRGTLQRIGSHAVQIMQETYHTQPQNLKVYLSPSIHQCCFEIWEEVKQKFEKEFSEIPFDDLLKKGDFKEEQKYYLDLIALNRRVLNNLWIPEENISASELCSCCHKETIHSYRGDKETSGRNLCLMMIKK